MKSWIGAMINRAPSLMIFTVSIIMLAGIAAAEEKEKEKQIKYLASPAEMESRGFLGVVPQDLDNALRAALEYEEPGVLLAEVIRGSAAEKAGVHVGDILVKLDEKPVHDSDRLMSLMKGTKPGESVDLLLIHLGIIRTVKVTLESRTRSTLIIDEDRGLLELNGVDLGESWSHSLDCGMNQLEIHLDKLDGMLENLNHELEVIVADPDDGDAESREVHIYRSGGGAPNID